MSFANSAHFRLVALFGLLLLALPRVDAALDIYCYPTVDDMLKQTRWTRKTMAFSNGYCYGFGNQFIEKPNSYTNVTVYSDSQCKFPLYVVDATACIVRSSDKFLYAEGLVNVPTVCTERTTYLFKPQELIDYVNVTSTRFEIKVQDTVTTAITDACRTGTDSVDVAALIRSKAQNPAVSSALETAVSTAMNRAVSTQANTIRTQLTTALDDESVRKSFVSAVVADVNTEIESKKDEIVAAIINEFSDKLDDLLRGRLDQFACDAARKRSGSSNNENIPDADPQNDRGIDRGSSSGGFSYVSADDDDDEGLSIFQVFLLVGLSLCALAAIAFAVLKMAK